MQKNQFILPVHSLEIQQISESHDLKDHAIVDNSHPKISNNKHDWNPVQYVNVLHQKINIKAVAILFLNILLKVNKFPFCTFGTLDMSGYFRQKSITYIKN